MSRWMSRGPTSCAHTAGVMAFCPWCGSHLVSAGPFCSECGHQLDDPQANAARTPIPRVISPVVAPAAPGRGWRSTVAVVWTLIFGALVLFGFVQVDGVYYTLENLARDVVITGAVWIVGLVVITQVGRG